MTPADERTPRTEAGRDTLGDPYFAPPGTPFYKALETRIFAIEDEAGAAPLEPHQHPLYDCGGKGHGSDVSEVQWCHDCTPHSAQPRDPESDE